jgi:Protein of unknown function (DUF3617)
MLFCSTVCSAVWGADFRTLDVKTGQWETTVSGQTTGMPPIPDEVLNRLTPEQRAKMQAMMQANSGSKPTVSRTCMTAKDLEKGFNAAEQSAAASSCSRVVVNSTGSKQEIRMECASGGTKSSGSIKLEAVDSEHVKGSMQMTSSNDGHTMNMNYTFASKWVGPACTEK